MPHPTWPLSGGRLLTVTASPSCGIGGCVTASLSTGAVGAQCADSHCLSPLLLCSVRRCRAARSTPITPSACRPGSSPSSGRCTQYPMMNQVSYPMTNQVSYPMMSQAPSRQTHHPQLRNSIGTASYGTNTCMHLVTSCHTGRTRWTSTAPRAPSPRTSAAGRGATPGQRVSERWLCCGHAHPWSLPLLSIGEPMIASGRVLVCLYMQMTWQRSSLLACHMTYY